MNTNNTVLNTKDSLRNSYFMKNKKLTFWEFSTKLVMSGMHCMLNAVKERWNFVSIYDVMSVGISCIPIKCKYNGYGESRTLESHKVVKFFRKVSRSWK